MNQNSDPSWIVFHRGGALGDFLLSMPLLKALSQAGHPVCVITRRRYLDVVPPGCRVDRFLDVDGPAVGGLFGSTALVPSLEEVLQAADAYVFCPHDSILDDQFTRHGVKAVHWLDSRPSVPPHVSLQFFRGAGLQPPPNLLRTPLWKQHNTGRHLWIHPGSGSSSKNAPLEYFAEYAAAWQHRHGREVWLSFGEADLHLKAPLENHLQSRTVRFKELVLPSLGELREALQSRAEAFVGNDCGVTHLAGLLGIPSVAFFRCTDPRIWHPIGDCIEAVGPRSTYP